MYVLTIIINIFCRIILITGTSDIAFGFLTVHCLNSNIGNAMYTKVQFHENMKHVMMYAKLLIRIAIICQLCQEYLKIFLLEDPQSDHQDWILAWVSGI